MSDRTDFTPDDVLGFEFDADPNVLGAKLQIRAGILEIQSEASIPEQDRRKGRQTSTWAILAREASQFGPLVKLPKEVFDTPDEIYAADWRVD